MRLRIAASALVLMLAAVGCEDGPPPEPTRLPAAKKDAKPKKAAGPEGGSKPEAAVNEVAEVTFTDEDFVESESNRDPFRSFLDSFVVKAPPAPQRLVLMPDVSVNQMRLIAIVTGADKPRAMLVDPKGVGHVASRGDFIGRPEVVQTGGRESLPVTLNWRVDRIRPSEVVLAREDPSSPNRAPLTLVLSLHTAEGASDGLSEASTSDEEAPEFENSGT